MFGFRTLPQRRRRGKKEDRDIQKKFSENNSTQKSQQNLI